MPDIKKDTYNVVHKAENKREIGKLFNNKNGLTLSVRFLVGDVVGVRWIKKCIYRRKIG